MKLIELRKKNNKTQKEIAEYLSITQSGYSNYECGKTEPDINILKKLSKFYNVSVDYLIENELENDIGFLTKEQVKAVKLLKALNRDNLMVTTGRMLEILEKQEKEE